MVCLHFLEEVKTKANKHEDARQVCWESTSFILYKLSNVLIPVTLTPPLLFRIHE